MATRIKYPPFQHRYNCACLKCADERERLSKPIFCGDRLRAESGDLYEVSEGRMDLLATFDCDTPTSYQEKIAYACNVHDGIMLENLQLRKENDALKAMLENALARIRKPDGSKS